MSFVLQHKWHFLENAKKHFSGPEYEEIKNMMEEINLEVFEFSFNRYLAKHPGGFMEVNYGPKGKIATPKEWATCHSYSHPRTSMIAGITCRSSS